MALGLKQRSRVFCPTVADADRGHTDGAGLIKCFTKQNPKSPSGQGWCGADRYARGLGEGRRGVYIIYTHEISKEQNLPMKRLIKKKGSLVFRTATSQRAPSPKLSSDCLGANPQQGKRLRGPSGYYFGISSPSPSPLSPALHHPTFLQPRSSSESPWRGCRFIIPAPWLRRVPVFLLPRPH